MKIGCKLPGGITIETGTPGTPTYAFYDVPGRKARGRGFVDGVAEVPDSVANAWFKKNAKLRLVIDGSVYRA